MQDLRCLRRGTIFHRKVDSEGFWIDKLKKRKVWVFNTTWIIKDHRLYPNNPQEQIPEPLSKMTKGDKKKYIADVRFMNYILQANPNDIYIQWSVNAKDICLNCNEKGHSSAETTDTVPSYDDKARPQAQSIDFELKLQHQKEKMACDVPWKSKLSTLNFENVLLKGQVESVVQERENIKLEFQKLFNSIKITRSQHQKEVDELIQHVIQKTYAYGDVRVENQDLLMTISKLKRKHVCVTSFKKQIADKAMNASNSKVNSKRSKPVTSQSTSKPEQGVGSSHSVIQLILWIVDIGCSKHMTGNLQLLRNFVKKFMGIVRFGNDHFAAITGYGDYVQAISLFVMSIMLKALGTIYFRATSTKSWLWHRQLSHLNYDTINQLTFHDLVDGHPKFKYQNYHLCSACEQGKRRKASLSPKLIPSTKSKLILLHMDLCGPMRVASINGKKYILVIVDDYSRFTWVYFLRTKDEAPDMIIDFVNQVQRNLKASILTIQTDNGTEFKNKKLRAFYAKLGIVHNTSIARTPQQNGVVEIPIATACFTQNRSIVHTRHNKTLNDRDDLGKMKTKDDIGIFVGYSESSHGFRIYNRRTKKIMEMINVKFDELPTMASECNNLEPGMNYANFNDSSEDSQSIPSTSDLDNLFGPMYEEYNVSSSQKVFDNYAANTLDNDHTSSSSSIFVDQDDASLIVVSSEEQVVTK
ncbi:retrovirus-related pol polyprotein from transposon TNT 1-94 [Tanacetum coccineum]